MANTIRLKGVGWDHDRCMAPLLACSADYSASRRDVSISWDRRSLAHFGEGRLDELVEDYDFVIFDHPHSGQIANTHCFIDLSAHLNENEVTAFEADSLGPSWDSYLHDGGIWGLPIDAAAQVSCFRADLLQRVGANSRPQNLQQVLDLAKAAQKAGLWVAVPIVPIDAICTFLTLAANMGQPVSRNQESFPDIETTIEILESIRELVSICHPSSTRWNPIQCYDHMSTSDDVCYIPYAFGYTNYSRSSCERPLTFCDIPGYHRNDCSGALLGGAGIGISRSTMYVAEAVEFARTICGPRVQRGLYYRSGGQPASLSAWKDADIDVDAGGFFSGTRKTLENAYLRPTFHGYIDHFRDAGAKISDFVISNGNARALARWMIGDYYSAGPNDPGSA